MDISPDSSNEDKPKKAQATKHKQKEANKTEKKPKERHQNALLVPTSREVGSAKQPFFVNYILFSIRFK